MLLWLAMALLVVIAFLRLRRRTTAPGRRKKWNPKWKNVMSENEEHALSAASETGEGPPARPARWSERGARPRGPGLRGGLPRAGRGRRGGSPRSPISSASWPWW